MLQNPSIQLVHHRFGVASVAFLGHKVMIYSSLSAAHRKYGSSSQIRQGIWTVTVAEGESTRGLTER